MKFPSIVKLQEDGANAALRFPFSLLFGVLAAGLGVYLIEMETSETFCLLNLLLTFALGIPLYFCIDILAERKNLTPFQRQIAWVIGLVFLGLIYFSFPSEDTFANTRVPYIRYAIYNLAIHLMVAFLPYFGSDDQEGFWNYNKNLFIRLVQGIFYSLAIFIGISLALLAINALFDAKIQGNTYPQIFALTFGIFNTWFFLAGIPKTFENDLSLEEYPKGLKIFTQFILIPLLLIYLCILYFYGAKIIITGDWPKGIVSYMIIAIAVLGIFTNLLLYPYQNWREGDWIKKFHRGYYVFLIPLIILLFFAIGIRIQDYGLTVNRYIIALMGIWLAFITTYYSMGKKNIKIIPISLALLMIFSSFGPWGMFSLSESQQLNRLSEILTKNGILVNDKIQDEVKWEIGIEGSLKPIGGLRAKYIPSEELYEVNSILEYLEDYHGLEKVYLWFEQDFENLLQQSKNNLVSSHNHPSKILVESMNLTYVPYYERTISSEQNNELTLVADADFELKISGFDYIRHITVTSWDLIEKPLTDGQYQLEVDKKKKLNLILRYSDGSMNIDISDYLNNLLDSYKSGYQYIPTEELVITRIEENIEIKIQVSSITIANEEGKIKLQSLDGFLLVKEMREE